MLKKLIDGMGEAAGQLADWFQDLVADYTGELLAAHGLIEVEVDQIRKRREEEELAGKTGNNRTNVVWPDDFDPKNDAWLDNGEADVSGLETEWIASRRVRLWDRIETLVTVVLMTSVALALAFCFSAFVSREETLF
ncbi:MAG: hypothetical protein JO077_22025 [Verrucomicrobia bacterium]|nr:hypothetical protein [Verrucomicrobiota bacterium]